MAAGHRVHPLPVGAIGFWQRHHGGVEFGGNAAPVTASFVAPFPPLIECIRHLAHLFALARNGLSMVKASGAIPLSMRFQVTGAAIGNPSRARGE